MPVAKASRQLPMCGGCGNGTLRLQGPKRTGETLSLARVVSVWFRRSAVCFGACPTVEVLEEGSV